MSEDALRKETDLFIGVPLAGQPLRYRLAAIFLSCRWNDERFRRRNDSCPVARCNEERSIVFVYDSCVSTFLYIYTYTLNILFRFHAGENKPSISMALFLSLFSTISARTVKAGTKIISRRSLINRISEKFETFFSFFSFRIVERKLRIFVRSFSLSTGQKACYEDRVTTRRYVCVVCVYIYVYSSFLVLSISLYHCRDRQWKLSLGELSPHHASLSYAWSTLLEYRENFLAPNLSNWPLSKLLACHAQKILLRKF